ncbi:hypothetical protein ACIBG0_40250 [Nocardia sp. NPDC050630]|uniref:hypothetical protein n=1 Tax=Nocardia sp. NPDC050630 TaxID=3364321 RepID=UPI00379F4A06
MTEKRIAEALAKIAAARAQLLATGETETRAEGGRSPARSTRYRRARDEILAAEQERNRLLVELVGDAEVVPVALVQQLGLTGREAAHIIRTARGGSKRLHDLAFGNAES